ncbi:MAG TPA: FG-GAP-like repeat-containing protein [Flavobacteriales bacterium]|nr:FG-GAP-like repeat-containing protein [Flavobacteriales bacterium]
MKTGITLILVFVAGILYSQRNAVDELLMQKAIKQTESFHYQFYKNSEHKWESQNPAGEFTVSISERNQCVYNTSAEHSFVFNLYLNAIHKGNNSIYIYDKGAFTASNDFLKEIHDAYSIEYDNSPRGLKQNFIINKKPKGAGNLMVDLLFSGSGMEVIKLENNELIISRKGDRSRTELARYNGLLVYDASGKKIPSKFTLNRNELSIEVDDKYAIYPLTIDPISTTPTILNIGTIAGSNLGYCVSGAGDVNGDGYSDVVVGAPRYQNGQTLEGATYVYHGTATGIGSSPAIIIEGNIVMPTSEPSKYFLGVLSFGTSVSEAGDVNGDGYGDIIVGNPLLSNGNNGEGKAFVYYGSASGIDATVDWTYETNVDSSLLGFSVSSAGDVNNDGFSDVIIGAIQFTNGQSKEGIAYVFHGSAAGLSATPNTTLEGNVANAAFGWSVSTAGDVNGDQFDDVIVAAAYYTNGQLEEGAAYVFHGSAAGVSTTAAWLTESNQLESYYGENVSWAGDVNGDGYGDVIVGADYYSNSVTFEGIARVFHGSAAGLSTTPAVTLDQNKASSNFGAAVNGAGDVNGDGYGDVIVGAYAYNNGNAGEGAIYVFYGSSTGISNTLFTLFESNKNSTSLGISVAGCGDINGDGFSDIVSGAYQYDNVSPVLTNTGAIYVFHGVPEGIGTTALPSTPFSGAAANSSTGNFVTTIGDVNKDGFSDIAVGAQNVDIAGTGGTNRGAVYIFHGSATGYASAPNTTIPGPTLGAIAASNNCLFGCSIGAAGDVNGDGFSDIIIGASGYTNAQSGEGYFSIHLGSASGITVAPHLTVETNVAGAALGISVAGAGDVNGDGYSDVVVGATGQNRAYVYHGSSTGVDATSDWSYTVTGETFGACVAGVGDCNGDGYSDVVVLSSTFTNGQTNEGRLSYFRGTATGLEAAPGTLIETNVANAGLGAQSTSYIGDLNGDGFNDVVIGTSAFASGSSAEGALLITYGATPSLYFGSTQTVEGNAVSFLLGNTIGFGGDVNGDGYNDIITGAPTFNGGLANEGVARVYLGGPTAVATTPYFTMESNVAATLFGSSVSSAGDCNGDGFSDILIGASGFDVTTPSALTDAGRAYVFMGNNSHNVLPKTFLTRQFKSDLATVVQSSNGTFEAGCSFGIGHADKSHLGRASGKQIFEVRGHPGPFTGYATAMGNSVAFTGQQAAFTDLGLTGATMTYGVTAAAMGFPKWRTRTRFSLVDALDGQMNGRWYYGSIHDKQDRSIKINISCGVLPIELLNINLACENEKKQLKWEVASEDNVAQYKIYASLNGIDYELMEIMNTGMGNYAYEIPANIEANYIRLEIIDNNLFSTSFDKFLPNCDAQQNNLNAFPSPASEMLTIVIDNGEHIPVEVSIIDLSGRVVLTTDKANMNVSGLVSGIYHVVARDENGKMHTGKFSHY